MRTPVYLVAAPIGDYLQDMSVAAFHALRAVRHLFVEADDAFVARLREQQLVGQAHRVYSLETDQLGRAGELLEAGEPFALLASSGIPCFLDPGRHIVRLCLDRYLDRVELVPVGLSSALDAALCMCGVDVDRFHFNGHYPEHYAFEDPLPERSVPLVYFVRGPAVNAFVRDALRAVPDVLRIVVLKDVRKKQRARVVVLEPAAGRAMEPLLEQQDADYTCVLDRRPPEPTAHGSSSA